MLVLHLTEQVVAPELPLLRPGGGLTVSLGRWGAHGEPAPVSTGHSNSSIGSPCCCGGEILLSLNGDAPWSTNFGEII